jgi:N-acetylmuramoyl-L-alanine amidase
MRRTGSNSTLALLLLAAACAGSSRDAAPATPPPDGRPLAAVPAPTAAPAAPLTVTVADATVRAASGAALRMGDSGPAVTELQILLVSRGFWLGNIDGSFGPSTHHAVVALQKYWELGRDGVVGPQTWAAIDRNERARPFTTAGHLIEVDPRRQLVTVADDGYATWVLDSSTGAVEGTTPSGFFHVFRQVDGIDPGPNGPLYRPKYFYQGVAVHGYTSVPPYPASHGCVRVTNPAIDMLWATGMLAIGTLVWVY